MGELLMSANCFVDNKLYGKIIRRVLVKREMHQQDRNRAKSEV